MEESLNFSFLSKPVVWRAQPVRCVRKAQILLFHLCMGVSPTTGLSPIWARLGQEERIN